MTVFEDIYELWYNALEHKAVPTMDGPTSIETLLEARDRFEQMGNEAYDGVLVISLEMAREIPRGRVVQEPAGLDPLPRDHREAFEPLEDMITVLGGADRVAFICRSDAVRLDMEILEPTGVVAIDLDRGDA